MKRMRAILAFALCVIMTACLLSGLGPITVRQANAAGTDPVFDEEEFGKCYAKVLLSTVGNSYQSSGGYWLTGDVANATPYNPATIPAQSFDCCGLSITGLMAMGYTKFTDGTRDYPLNKQTGFNALRSVNGILYNHSSYDVITLVHRDSRYNIMFRIGQIVDVSTLTDVKPGTILINLANAKDVKPTLGSFSAGTIGGDSDDRYYISHTSVAVFSLEENPDYKGITKDNCWDTQAHFDRSHAALQDSWNRAYNKLKSLYGQTLADKVSGSHTYTKGSNSYTIPNMWDARARGFVTATTVGRVDGFYDPGASFHFITPYSNIWQVEAIETGVSVNNNPFGKFNVTYSVTLQPVCSHGDLIINKSDSATGDKLSGATFALYEWSESSAGYVVSSNYKILESRTGVYQIYNSSGDPDLILYTGDNKGKIRVIETAAPTGYSNIDTTTGKPYQWDKSFVDDGETHTITIDAKNIIEIGYVELTKSLDKAPTVDKTFWFRINGGPTGHTTTRWASVTVQAGKTSGTATISDLAVGSYVLSEVSGNNSTTAPTSGVAFPYTIENSKNVTVTANTTAPVTMKNTLDVGSVSITKNIDKASTVDHTFWFLISGGPDGYKSDKWVSITIAAGKTSGTATVSDLPIGTYTVSEVNGNNSTTAPTKGDAFPYKIESPKNVTVTKGATAPATMTNTLDTGSLQITKSVNVAATENKTFWFYVAGGATGNKYEKWVSLSVTAGQKSGAVTLTGLPIGAYTVSEVSGDGSKTAPTSGVAFPYTIESSKNVTVTSGATAPVAMTNTLDEGNLQITKSLDRAATVDKTFWFLASGGPSGYKTNKWVSITITAGQTSGTATITGLPIGAYTVSEVSGDGSTTAPTSGVAFPYTIESSKNVTVTKGATAPVTMTNTLDKGSVAITKSIDVAATEDKTFWFFITGGAAGYTTEKWVSITVSAGQLTGTVTVSDLPIGAYTVSEVSGNGSKVAPTGGPTFPYTIPAQQNVTVIKGTTAPVTMKNVLDKGSVAITKSLNKAATIDETFWFRVSGGTNGHHVDKWVSITITAGQLTGTATVTDLPIGAYTVSEVAADGSTAAPVNGVGFPFTIEDAKNISVTKGATAPVTVTNTLDEGAIKLTKSISKAATIDETFWFLVEGGADGYKTEKWVSITITAGQLSGTATLTGLSIGAYTVSEVVADGSRVAPSKGSAFPYTIESPKNVSVTKGATAPVTMTNTVDASSLKITKKLNVPAREDAVFYFRVSGGPDGYKLDRWDSITVVAGETVGELVIENLPVGTYTVNEVIADGSDVLANASDSFPYKVIGGGNVEIVLGETGTIEVRNEVYSAQLLVHKTDAESGAVLPGIEFGVYADADCKTWLQTLTTDNNGNITSKEISLGKQTTGVVYVKELKTDSLHVLDEDIVRVDLIAGETAVVKNGNWTNKPVKGQIVVKKTGEFFTSVITTDSKYGTVYAPQFTYGQLEGAQFSVFNKADVKVNADGTFSYDLTKSITTFTTETNGGESDYIPLGTYYVIETKAPTGYVLEGVLHEVHITKASETKEIVLKDVKSQNNYQDTSVIIYKEAEYLITTEDNGIIRTTVQVMPGEGFVFGLFAKTEYVAMDGKKIPADGLVAYGSTDENGELVFDAQLPHGVYYVKELETLPDYIIDEDVYEVDLSYDADATEIVVEASEDALINRLRTTPVTITKRTLAGDDPLPGTEITIWNEDGRVIFKELTGADGTVPAVVLLKGHNYTFQETYAPEGYAVLYQKIPFKVELDGTITGTTTIRDDVSRISFLKVDDDDKPLAGAEFTLYDENGLPIKSVISDENGIAEFTNLGYGKYVIIETQTPKGYSLSDFRYEIEIDGTYENKEPVKVVNHELPKTGVENPLLIILCFLLVAIVSIMAIFSKKKDSFVHVEEYYRQ